MWWVWGMYKSIKSLLIHGCNVNNLLWPEIKTVTHQLKMKSERRW